MKKFLFMITLLVFISMSLLLNVCCNEQNSTDDKLPITILITKDYGKEKIATKEVKYKKGKTAMDMLVDNFEVETSYGGSFIKSINGIVSETKSGDQDGEDWIYFINGKEATVGANGYIVKPGDEIWFDFHKWNMESIEKQYDNKKSDS